MDNYPPLKIQQCRALIGDGDFGDTQTEISINDDDFSAGDEAAGNEQPHGFIDELIELDDCAGHQAEDFAEQHVSLAEANRGLKFDV